MPQSRFRKRDSEKRVQYNSDKKKLAVTAYLNSIFPKGGTKHNISTHAKIRSQEATDFDNFMNGLVRIGWADKSESAGGNDLFYVTEKGQEALNKAKELSREDHPLAALEALEDIQDF